MALKQHLTPVIPQGLVDAIRSMPVERETEHCGISIATSPLEMYCECPRCGTRIKLRSFSGVDEVEDVFDAVLEWMNQPLAHEAAERRRQQIADDAEVDE